jgi:putative transposase
MMDRGEATIAINSARAGGCRIRFAPIGPPTGNAVAERFIQTLKLELIWLRDWEDIEELRVAIELWRRFYNDERPHEALDWQTPSERRAQRLPGDRLLPVAA